MLPVAQQLQGKRRWDVQDVDLLRHEHHAEQFRRQGCRICEHEDGPHRKRGEDLFDGGVEAERRKL